MATKILIPSNHWRSSSSYVSVSNASNMYTGISSDTYATLTSTRAVTTAYYAYINGFDMSQIPAGATVTGFVVKIRGYQSGISTSASYRPCLTNTVQGSVFADTTASSSFDSSDSIIEIPTGSLTWSDIVNYGSSFSIRVSVTRAKANTQGYLYIYGAEIEVTYESTTPPGLEDTYVKQNGLWVPVNKMLVKQSGVWNEASGLFVKDNGIWK